MQILESVWLKFSVLSQPVVFLKVILIMFHMIGIQGREPYKGDFVKKKSTFRSACVEMLLNCILVML